MNPALLDDMSWEMAEVYGAVTDQILINLSRYFPYYESGNDVPKSAFTYQAAMLAQMGQVNRETVRIIRNGLADADGALKGVLEAAIIDSVRQAEPELYDAVKKGVLALPTTPVLAPQQMRAFKLYYEQAAEKLNIVNTVMLESTQSAYQQAVSGIVSEMEVVERIGRTQTALDAAAGETISGVSAWNQAVKHATDRMKESGITGFIDHGGHHWSAEAYAAMDIRTTTFNTARAAVWETNENFGNDLYLVSSHSGARPLCYPWQNKVISSINASREVPDLDGNPVHVYAQYETSYGQPAGLFGINCGHFPNPFIPGISSADFPVQDKAENDKVYAESQEQRRLERKLREEKRDLAMAKAQGASDEEIKKLREKCRNTSQDIDDFCEQTGRTRHRDREAVYTKREFPDRKGYDVSKFETEQKERLEEYWKDGGAQQGRNFQQMTPSVQINQGETTERTLEGAREKAITDYKSKIENLERQRLDLISSGSEDFETSDKLYAEIEQLEKKKRILEGGGFTIDQATVTSGPFTVNPNSSSMIDLKKADIYTMPDGKQFVFKSGMNIAHQSLTPEELIDAYYEMPKGLRDKSQNVIAVVDRYNPADTYWRKTYKNFTHSYMTGGDQITIYRHDRPHDMNYFKKALDHEGGHFLDRATTVGGVKMSDSAEWAEAMAKDKLVSGMDSITSYGKNAKVEDFAESVAYYITRHDYFVEKMPNRAKALDRILGIGGASP